MSPNDTEDRIIKAVNSCFEETPYYYIRNGVKTLIDGSGLIKWAKELGYDSDDGIYYTSEAASYLRRNLKIEIGSNK